jgi:beta-lactamase class A
MKGFRGDIGIYIRSLRTGKTVEINPDDLFPTASIVKVPLLIGIMHRIDRGELGYHQKLHYADTLNYEPGEDIFPYLKPGSPIELSKIIMLMMTISDNNASLCLQGLAGSGIAINKLMDSLGYGKTRVNSRTPGRESFRKEFGWGQTTPREMGQIFQDIAERKMISPTVSDKMLRIMSRQYWDEEAISGLPADVFVADKNGAVNASRSEVMFVNGPHPYIFSVFTANNKDISWEPSNEAWELTRKLSALCWEYFK